MQLNILIEKSNYFLNKKLEKISLSEVKDLQEIIKNHSDLYYNNENSIISDFEYDKLLELLKSLEHKFWLSENQSSKVWAEILESTFEKVAHSRPMISLDNTYNEEDLCDFDERVKKLINSEENQEGINLNSQIAYAIEFKFDWLWVELIYKNWKLTQAITRWNGVVWEDVTQNVLQISNIPKIIKYKEDLEVRGEVVMPISSFKKLNKEALENWWKIFSNPRNASSWSLRILDTSVTKKRNLKFFAYDLANFEEFIEKEKKETYFNLILDLKELWFEISSYFKVCNWIDEVIKNIDNFWDTKKNIDFEIDWLVIKVNSIFLWNQIGFTEHHPRYAIAYKFPSELVRTKILSIEHSVWRTWSITPVANLEAVNVTWVIVKRATLHNYDELEKKWVMIWDQVWIKRAWEVIPEIVSAIPEVRNWDEISIEIPKICPVCSSIVKKDEWKVRYYCPNKFLCTAQLEWNLIYAVGKTWLNIDWLWERQIILFLKLWLIKNLIDVFDLEDKKDELLKLEWFKEKSVSNLLDSIKKARKQNLISFITALWIEWVWKKTAKVLSKVLHKKNELLDFRYSIEDLLKLEDFWPETSYSVFEFFNNQSEKQFLTKLLEKIEIIFESEKKVWWKFAWKRFCITWSFENYSREEIIEILEKDGGEFISSVSKKLDFLIAWKEAGSKLKKAQDLWVKVISLDEVL